MRNIAGWPGRLVRPCLVRPCARSVACDMEAVCAKPGLRTVGLQLGTFAGRMCASSCWLALFGAPLMRSALAAHMWGGSVLKVGVFSLKSEGSGTPTLNTFFGRVLKVGALSIKTVGFLRSDLWCESIQIPVFGVKYRGFRYLN